MISGNRLLVLARQRMKCSRHLIARAQVSGHLPPRPSADGWPDEMLETLITGLQRRVAESRASSNRNLARRWDRPHRDWPDGPYTFVPGPELPPLPPINIEEKAMKKKPGRPKLEKAPTPPALPVTGPYDAARATLNLLSSHFGDERKAVEFARAFSGMKLVLPPPAMLERVIGDERRHKILLADPSTGRMRQIGQIHGLGLRGVAQAFKRSNDGIGIKDYRKMP